MKKIPKLPKKEWRKVHTIPKIIKLGYQDIKVSESDMPDAQGFYRAEEAEIRIKQGMDSRELLNTLLHEALHACVYVYGLKKDFKTDDEEEKFVNALGNGLTELLVRNPDIVKLIGEVE